MRKLDQKHIQWLENNFPGRYTIDPRERSMYSHDIGSIPATIRPFLGNTTPSAVVQPVSEEEVQKPIKWALSERIPLVPRGKSTSGYGGVLPVKGVIVVDFCRMAEVIEVKDETVTVHSGIS